MCDMVSLLPFCLDLPLWIQHGEPSTGERDMLMRAVSIVKLLRLFKFARYYFGMKILVVALSNSLRPLMVPLCFLFMVLTFFAFVINLVEDDYNTFTDVPHALWFLSVTMTTG